MPILPLIVLEKIMLLRLGNCVQFWSGGKGVVLRVIQTCNFIHFEAFARSNDYYSQRGKLGQPNPVGFETIYTDEFKLTNN